jgi:hypothetical protein
VTEAGAPPHEELPRADAGTRPRLTVLVAVGALVLAVIVAVLALRRDVPGEPGSAPSATAAPPGPVRVERLAHEAGDCVSWDQEATAAADPRATATVACTEPHLVEITGRVQLGDELDHEPTEAELDALTDRLCQPVNEAHLGGPLDPHGRYYPAGIQPSPESWRDGDREVWCALGAHDGTEGPDDPAGDGRHRPFRGAVALADQFWRYDRGQCLGGGRRAAVACIDEHEVEVVGRVELPEAPFLPELDDQAAWEILVGPECRAQARSYLDRETVEPLTTGWLGIEQASWAAGQRSAHCVVGEREAAGGWVTVTGSARSIPS